MTNFYSHCHQKFSDDNIFIEQPTIDQHYRYGDLNKHSAQIANYLSQLGLSKGDCVMVQVEKSVANLFWYFACIRAGLIYLPLNTAYKESELRYFVTDAKPSLILCDPRKTDLFQTLTKAIEKPPIILCMDSSGQFSPTDLQPLSNSINPPHAQSGSFQDVACTDAEVAVILYTSGTTGHPKGAMITHGNLTANAEVLSETWQWQEQDVMLHSLPIFHIHGLFVAIHLAVLNSSKIIFLDKFETNDVIKYLPNATVFMGVPTHYVRLLDNTKLTTETCKNMRLFTSGSAPLLTQTFNAFSERSGHTIVERYGMTETGMNTSNPIDGERKAGTVGLPLDGVSVKLEDVDNTTQTGNLLVKGDNVFLGYWQMPEKTADEFTSDGYFKTGDLALIDKDGYVTIVGRNKDLIITGGLNVYPKEIETIIDAIPGVDESAVIGLEHSDFGEAVTAVIVKRKLDLTDIAITKHLKASVAGFKVPKQIYFVEELPRNTMGKVQKAKLREMFSTKLSNKT